MGATSGVTVIGSGSVTVDQDIAIVRFGAKAEASDVRVAVTKANAAATAARDAVLAAGVAARDISSGRATTWTERDKRRCTASLSLRAVVRDVAQVGEIVRAALDAAGEHGDLDQIQFAVDDPAPHEVIARDRAFAEARAKAEQFAALAGRRLGAVVEIVDGAGGGYGGMGVLRGATPMMARGAAISAPIVAEPGTVEVDASVTVRWELAD